MKILFLTDDRKGAIEALNWLNGRYHVIGCVFDQSPDSSLLKTCSRINVPAIDSKEIYNLIGTIDKPDIIVSYLFRHRILKALIDAAPVNRYGYRNIINFHPAPLPDAKGVGMSSQAILQGFTEWGVSAHYVNEQYDEGDLIEVDRFPVPDRTTSIEFQITTQIELLKLLKKTIPCFENGGVIGRRQEAGGHYYSNKTLQASKVVTGCEDSEELKKKVHGLFFPPYDGAFVEIHGEKYTLIDQVILKKLELLYQQYETMMFEKEMRNTN